MLPRARRHVSEEGRIWGLRYDVIWMSVLPPNVNKPHVSEREDSEALATALWKGEQSLVVSPPHQTLTLLASATGQPRGPSVDVRPPCSEAQTWQGQWWAHEVPVGRGAPGRELHERELCPRTVPGPGAQ